MRTLIVANGAEPPSWLLGRLARCSNTIIAADGGATVLLREGIAPDVVTGDMDSFDPPDGFSAEVLVNPDQETNDLEKALSLALTMKSTRVDVLGATGKRLDHSLKNLSVMQQFAPRFKSLAFFDQHLFSCVLPRTFTIALPVSHAVSLFPLSGRVDGICTSGLLYALDDDFLENGVRDGSSNLTTQPEITITHRSGVLLFMTALTDSLIEDH